MASVWGCKRQWECRKKRRPHEGWLQAQGENGHPDRRELSPVMGLEAEPAVYSAMVRAGEALLSVTRGY